VLVEALDFEGQDVEAAFELGDTGFEGFRGDAAGFL
jgi:hypothetical protein